MRLYREEVVKFWREHPGEKALLAAQAARMLWNPVPSESDSTGSGAARQARSTVEPAFMVALYALAIAGLFFAPRHFVALVLLLVSYNTLAAMVFAGTARYRAPVGLPARTPRGVRARRGLAARAKEARLRAAGSSAAT